MPARRRKKIRGQTRGRIPWGALAFVALLIVVVVYGINTVNHAMRRAGRHRVVVPEASAQPAATAAAQPSVPLVGPSTAPTASAKLARVAIIIDDCGNSMQRDGQFLGLPIPLTLSILPWTPHGKEIAVAAQAAGKNVMLHLPMQPESDTANPGPGAIETSMTDEQVQRQVEADIDSLPPLPGGNNHMGSKATSDPRIMRDVLDVFQQRHLFFIDSETGVASVGAQTAKQLGIPTAERDVFLDNSLAEKDIENQLLETQRVALRSGSAIAIGHPNPTTAQALAAMIPKMEAAGITFVPAQTLVR